MQNIPCSLEKVSSLPSSVVLLLLLSKPKESRLVNSVFSVRSQGCPDGCARFQTPSSIAAEGLNPIFTLNTNNIIIISTLYCCWGPTSAFFVPTRLIIFFWHLWSQNLFPTHLFHPELSCFFVLFCFLPHAHLKQIRIWATGKWLRHYTPQDALLWQLEMWSLSSD